MSILNFSVFVSVFLGFKLLFNYDEEKVITFCFFVVLFFLVNTLSDGISEHLKTQIQIVDMEFRKLLERKQVVISDLIKLNILINGFNNFIIKFFS